MVDQNGLINKLKIGSFARRLILNKPETVRELDGLAYEREIDAGPYDFILIFVFSLPEMAAGISDVLSKALLADHGLLYLAYPKKSGRRYTNSIGRDEIFPYLGVSEETGHIGQTALKFNSLSSFNEDFTIIGIRHQLARAKQPTGPSQRSEDYIGYLPDLQQYLSGQPEILQRFAELAPGYQRDWARYVFSAQTESTRQKRLNEMADILRQGYKSISLYRQRRS